MTKYLLSLLLMLTAAAGCSDSTPETTSALNTSEGKNPKTATDPSKASLPRNVILLIGDGMGPQQIALLKLFIERSRSAKTEHPNSALLELLKQGTRGIVFPWSHDGIVVDSACSTSQLATGSLCRSESLGVDENGFAVQSIAERAKNAGRSVGLVTDTRITHATPAAFGSHQLHRSSEGAIAEELIETNFDVLLGGGLRHFLPATPEQSPAVQALAASDPSIRAMLSRSKRSDQRNLLTDARKSGYEVVLTRSQLAVTEAPKVLGIFAESGMADAISARRASNDPQRREPTLAEMSTAALRLLERNKEGFFLMIEGGQIDWAAHHNDAGLLLHELLKFDEAIATVLQWARGRDDTLVVMTADHETGSFGFSYSAHQIPEPEFIANTAFSEQGFKPRYNFISPNHLDRLFNQKGSFLSIERKFRSLPETERTAAQLGDLIYGATNVRLPDADLIDILTTAPNPFHRLDHNELKHPMAPLLGDKAAFYPEIEYNRIALMAQKLAPHQGVVWGTGTHTSTPVFVVATGVQAERFNGVFHTAELGSLLQSVSGLEKIR